MTLDIFKFSMYTCGCGYKTVDKGNSSKHKKVPCGHEMTVTRERFILEREYLETLSEKEDKMKNKVSKVMREYKSGTLKSSSGDKVKSRDQAIAIALSEAGMAKKGK